MGIKPINNFVQEKVYISKVFNTNFKQMFILEGHFFMCPTPCRMALLLMLRQCMVLLLLPFLSKLSLTVILGIGASAGAHAHRVGSYPRK